MIIVEICQNNKTKGKMTGEIQKIGGQKKNKSSKIETQATR